jgi:hypothetical protein
MDKILNFFLIKIIFLWISLNLYPQSSSNFLLFYESFEKIKEIEKVIKENDKNILRKYGLTPNALDGLEELNSDQFFVGYQVKNFGNFKLLELKYNKDGIERFFLENSIPFVSSEKKVDVYISVNDPYLPGNISTLDETIFQNELSTTKLLSKLNQNIDLNYRFIEKYPFFNIERDNLMEEIELANEENWVLMLFNRLDLENWVVSFPKTKTTSVQAENSFQDLLLNQLLFEVYTNTKISKKSYTTKFSLSIDEDVLESFFSSLGFNPEIQNFGLYKITDEAFEVKYESYLDDEELADLFERYGLVVIS